MDPFVQLFVGIPLTEPLSMARKFFDSAVIADVTSTKIVLMDEDGGKAVFFGDFENPAGIITGTMTGFKYKDGDVKLIEGGGYEIDAADLLDALNEGGGGKKVDAAVGEITTIFDLLLPDGILIEGSDQGDYLQEINADGATVKGRKGDDLLGGGDGNQVLKGNKGADFLFGGGEKDKLFGGKGNDVFAFGPTALDPRVAVDPPVAHKIMDFSHKDDTIVLSTKEFGFGFLDEDLFKKGAAASSEDHRIIYHKSTGKLYVDEDGSGIMEQVHIGTLTPGTNVKANDIYLGGLPIIDT